MYTQDIPDSFFVDIKGVAQRLRCDPLDLLKPLMNESGLSFKAHNPVGDAAGIFQAMPNTLRHLGYQGSWQDFCALDADQQLPWLERYYKPFAGKLVNAQAVYMATFCPAWLQHAAQDSWIICSKDGPCDSWLSLVASQLWYKQNSGLDINKDGLITVGDLGLAISRADQGPRWAEIVSRLNCPGNAA